MEDSREGVLLGSQAPKTLIAIVSCQKYIQRLKSSLDTWVPQVIAAGYDVEVFTGPRLNVPDDYYSLPQKVKAICQWAVANDYQYMLKTDEDSYIRVSRFETVTADYAGLWAPANDCGSHAPPPCVPESPKGTYPYDYASGGAYWLARRSLEIIANHPIDDWAEDRWVGNTLAKHGIPLTVLPGYCGGEGSIEKYLIDSSIVITQVAGRTEGHNHDMMKCHQRFNDGNK